ncbi:N-acetylmuramoyl-L-alanine amidase-like domain-containing protein [Marinomonas shanghaiensis]|uniref:N-acetylmuramoyl-L-alanine amidase-like domain-containing protein n=1 Tax=Marinomonas shanghaiensis TaxID=2202418 RepID=UPI003A948D82
MKHHVGRVFVATSVLCYCLLSTAAQTEVDNRSPVNAVDAANRALFYQAIDHHSVQRDVFNASSYAEKMLVLSQVFLGAEYVGGSVGEGPLSKYDKDPLVRFDVFDCTTYVETLLAGVMSTSSAEFETNLMALRYQDGDVSFVSRNHFPSLDWFHNNQDKLQDITPEVAGGAARVAQTLIDKAAWYQHLTGEILGCDATSSNKCATLLGQLKAEGSVFSPEPAYLPYVPLTALFVGAEGRVDQALLDRIPSGSVISMVRPDWSLKQWIGTNMNVSHQGIAIRKQGVLFLRHASLTHKKVMDENFAEYFSHYASGTSSLKGFNVHVLRH